MDVLARVLPSAAFLTIYMCWHGGHGHGYPQAALAAAGRLRERHMPQAGSDDTYTALTFPAVVQDLEDVEVVVPFCDLAYATDAAGEVLAAVSVEEDNSARGR